MEERLDIWGNICIPDHLDRCPCCGGDRAELFGMGHQSCCDYGTGRDLAGAKERRKKWLDKL